MKLNSRYLYLSTAMLGLMIVVALGLRLLLPGEYLFINRLGRTYAWLAFGGLYVGMITRSIAGGLSALSPKSSGQLSARLANLSSAGLWLALHAAIAHVLLMLFKQLGISALGGLPDSFQYAVALGAVAIVGLLQIVVLQIMAPTDHSRSRAGAGRSIAINAVGFVVTLHLWFIGQSLQYTIVRSGLTMMLVALAAAIGFEVSARLSQRSKPLAAYSQFIAAIVTVLVFAFAAGAVNMINNYQPESSGGSSGGHH